MFTICLSLGVGLGLAWSALAAPRPLALRLIHAGWFALGGGLLGARLGYVAWHWPYYQQQPWEIFQTWQGGLSGPGAWAGALLGLLFAARLTGLPLGLLADRLLPLASCLAASAWLGCWLTGSAYGLPGDSLWAALPAPDETGRIAQRLPVQVVGLLSSLGLLALLDLRRSYFRSRLRDGLQAGLWLAAQGLLLWGLSYLRADPTPLWQGLRLDAWGGLAIALVGGFWLALRLWLRGSASAG